ncbi:MAG: radical SAM protein [Sandaracinaceae bacterium]
MTRTLLVGPDFEDNLSIRYLSAALHEAGFDAELAAFNGPDDVDAVAEAAVGYDLIGLSICFQSKASELFALAARLRGVTDATILAGGHYATCAAEDILRHHRSIDAIALHEGERSIVELARAGCERSAWRAIAGLVFRDADGALVTTEPRRSETDLDALPIPDRRGRVHLFAGVPTAWLLGSRGCVATCDYCCIVTLHEKAPGRKFRQRDPELVAREMAALERERGIRNFVFHDDNFLVPRQEKNHARLDAYEQAFARHGLTDIGLTLKCRPPDADRAVFERLKGMGLLRVYFGIESASEAGLCSVGRVQTVEQSVRAIGLARELGISAQFSIMIFHPDATFETVRTDLSFMRRNAFHALNFCRVELYAGTPLEARMRSEGRTYGDYLATNYRIANDAIEMTCQLAHEIFGDRNWKPGSLYQNLIGLDHLTAVARRFYDGPEARALFAEIDAHRERTNLETIELLEELFEAIAGADDLESDTLADHVVALARREHRSRVEARRVLTSLRARLDAYVARRVGLERDPDRPGTYRMSAARAGGLARHAAAVAIAFATASACDANEPPDEPTHAEPATPEPPPVDVTPEPEPEPEPPPQHVVRIDTEPAGAEIQSSDGVVLGNTPLDIPVSAPMELTIQLDGYTPRTVVLTETSSSDLLIALEAIPGPARRRRLPVAPTSPHRPTPPPRPRWHEGLSEESPWKIGDPVFDRAVIKILDRIGEERSRSE